MRRHLPAAVTLLLLLLHAWHYRFLTDDAFISFRYASNLAEGHGLVFNPGFERVEGYTNFLWVLVLAALRFAGIPPERAANALSIACAAGIWLALYRRQLRHAPGPWGVLAPLALLAATRSFAVWSTGGLETKLFELLVVLGVFRAAAEVDAARAGGPQSWRLSSLFLGLAALTRPEGVLIGLAVLSARLLAERRRGGAGVRAALPGLAIFAAIVLGHVALRLAYYGDVVPNTYHAKVGGKAWWPMGFRYLILFAMEYGAIFWLPLLAAGVLRLARSGRGHHALLVAAATLPYLTGVLAVGGDHFEYRPLDLLFPFAFVLIGEGAVLLAASGARARALAAACLFLAAATSLGTAYLGHAAFPSDYRPGFPGARGRDSGSKDLIPRERYPGLLRTPVLGWWIARYNEQMEIATVHGVGIRQEEHALFLPTMESEGKRLARLVRDGIIPADTHIAVGSVGALPYYSGLRTLDRLGLTDRTVARGPSRPEGRRMMAHNKLASFAYAKESGVDLWACDATHLLFGSSEKRLEEFAENAIALGVPLVAARADSLRFLLAVAPGGLEGAARRLPRLAEAGAFFRVEAARPNARWWVHATLGDLLAAQHDVSGAIRAYETALAKDPIQARRAREKLGELLSDLGEIDLAIPHLERAVADEPTAQNRRDLAQAYIRKGAFGPAVESLREGVRANPDDPGLQNVLARILVTCPDPAVRDPEEALRIAEMIRRRPAGNTALYLDTVGAAYANAGRWDEAQRVAIEAAGKALANGDTAQALQIRQHAEAYAGGRTWW